MDGEFCIQARRQWDKRYGDLNIGKRNRQITAAGEHRRIEGVKENRRSAVSEILKRAEGRLPIAV